MNLRPSLWPYPFSATFCEALSAWRGRDGVIAELLEAVVPGVWTSTMPDPSGRPGGLRTIWKPLVRNGCFEAHSRHRVHATGTNERAHGWSVHAAGGGDRGEPRAGSMDHWERGESKRLREGKGKKQVTGQGRPLRTASGQPMTRPMPNKVT